MSTTYNTVEPIELLSRNYACCVDKASFIEKTARFYGYDTRHIFMIQHRVFKYIKNFLPLIQDSHAASEILTSRGWLGVDYSKPIILFDKHNFPLTFQYAINSIEQFPDLAKQDLYQKPLTVIYGLYSRHGYFHGKNFPGPEFVLNELKWNLQ